MTIPTQGQRHPRPVRRSGGLHYGWIIVGILVVVQVIGSALSQSAGVMVAPLRDPHGAFGWGIGTIGALLAVYYLVGALFAPVSGWLGERYGARHLMLAGGLLYGGSMVLLGLVRQPWHFLLTFSVLLSLTQSICLVPLIAAVSGWFRRRLGLATGLLWAAGGLGAAGLAPLVGYLMDHLGWQGTFWSLGLVGGGILLSLTLLFRNRPADLGLVPYGATAADPPEVARSPVVGERGVDVLPLWRLVRHRLWRRDVGLPGGEPPVFRDGAHQHLVWLRDDGRPARARGGDRAGRAGPLRHGLVSARPGAVYG